MHAALERHNVLFPLCYHSQVMTDNSHLLLVIKWLCAIDSLTYSHLHKKLFLTFFSFGNLNRSANLYSALTTQKQTPLFSLFHFSLTRASDKKLQK